MSPGPTAPCRIRDDRRDVIVQRLRVDDETAHLLATLFPVAGREDPVVIAPEWQPWYGEAVKAQRSFYWEHYSGYLADGAWLEP